jgi:DNA-binding IclR family transcriptional regulator
MNRQTQPYPGTQSVLRAVAVLKCFDEAHPRWRLSELARSLELNKTTVFRLLSALESEGLLARDESSESYVLGPGILTIAGHALRSYDLRDTVHPYLESLAVATGETASLEIVSTGQMLIIDEVLGEHRLGGARSIGTRWPIHGSSTGLAILATWPASRRDGFLRQELEPLTAYTLTDSNLLETLLEQVQNQGYAVSDEMLESGLIAIGASLRDFEGKAEAAVSIYGPKSRLPAERVAEIGLLLKKSAAAISAKMGHCSAL